MEKNKHFQKIKEFYGDHKRMPSYGEIRDLAGFKSKNAAFALVKKLASFNLVGKDRQGKILPGRSFYEVPILGLVEAGFPSPAEEELSDTISLDQFLLRNKESTYMLKVSGDSMNGAGIIAGDLVLVERGGEAKFGDIVIAQIDGEWTIKYLRKKNNRVFLEPANAKYRPIFPKQSLKIAAVVTAVIRKYK